MLKLSNYEKFDDVGSNEKNKYEIGSIISEFCEHIDNKLIINSDKLNEVLLKIIDNLINMSY